MTDGTGLGKAKKSFFRKKLLARNFSHLEDREEFRILDYMPAINSRPIDLHDPLRVRRAGRTIKAFLCITMYNEHADELKRSLRGVADNLDQLEPALLWEEFAVCIVVDGRHKMSKSVLQFAEKELKLFDPDLVKVEHNGAPVTAHIFEKSVELAKHTSQREYFKPLQMILCIKERNGGKLNSHLWYFSAFCRQLQPKFWCVAAQSQALTCVVCDERVPLRRWQTQSTWAPVVCVSLWGSGQHRPVLTDKRNCTRMSLSPPRSSPGPCLPACDTQLLMCPPTVLVQPVAGRGHRAPARRLREAGAGHGAEPAGGRRVRRDCGAQPARVQLG